MTHLLLGKSEVACDLIAFPMVNISKEESPKAQIKDPVKFKHFYLFLSQMTYTEDGF